MFAAYDRIYELHSPLQLQIYVYTIKNRASWSWTITRIRNFMTFTLILFSEMLYFIHFSGTFHRVNSSSTMLLRSLLLRISCPEHYVHPARSIVDALQSAPHHVMHIYEGVKRIDHRAASCLLDKTQREFPSSTRPASLSFTSLSLSSPTESILIS